MRLTPEQVERLSGVVNSVCRLVLDDLVRAGFLSVRADGTYARATGLDRMTSRSPSAESNQRPTASILCPLADAPRRHRRCRPSDAHRSGGPSLPSQRPIRSRVSVPDVRSARSFPSTRTSRGRLRSQYCQVTDGDGQSGYAKRVVVKRAAIPLSLAPEPLAQIMTGLCVLSRRPIASCNFWIPTRGRRSRRWLFRCNRATCCTSQVRHPCTHTFR